MNSKFITIPLCRVSSDSQSLDMIFDCGLEYYFTSLILNVKLLEGNQFISKSFDLSDAVFGSETEEEKQQKIARKHWSVQVPLNRLGISSQAIYECVLTASPIYNREIETDTFKYALPVPFNDPDIYCILSNEGATAGLVYAKALQDNDTVYIPVEDYNGNQVHGKILKDCEELDTNDIQDTIICSDVNYAYECMLDDIIAQTDRCAEVSDSAIMKYLILYVHQAAMYRKDIETAEQYFKLMSNCFNKCGQSKSSNNHSCNCRV